MSYSSVDTAAQSAVARLWQDSQRVREGRLRVFAIITDIVGVLTPACDLAAASLAKQGRSLTISGLDKVPSLAIDADRMVAMAAAMLGSLQQLGAFDAPQFLAEHQVIGDQHHLELSLDYGVGRPDAMACATLIELLDGLDSWLAAAPLALTAPYPDDLPGPVDFADLAWTGIMAKTLGGSLVFEPNAGDTQQPMRLVLELPVSLAESPEIEATAAEDDLDLDDPLIAVSRGTLARTRQVLLVEDAAVTSRLISDYVHKLGHRVQVVERGAEVLPLVQRHAFDLVLLDLTLPDTTGWVVMEQLQAYRQQADDAALGTIYVFTASAEPDLPNRLAAAGFDGLLKKPIDWDQLRDLLSDPDAEMSADEQKQFQLSGYVSDWTLCRDVPVIDGTIQQQLIEILGEDALGQLIDNFDRLLDDYLRHLADNRVDGNDAAWRQECHDMKSMAGSLGAMRLSHMAHVLTHHGWPSAAREAAVELQVTVQLTRDSLRVPR